MTEREVFVVDRVITRPGRAREFIDTYLAEYAPGAVARGMALRTVLVSPPIWLDDKSNTVTITWSLAGPQAWWQMTWKHLASAAKFEFVGERSVEALGEDWELNVASTVSSTNKGADYLAEKQKGFE